ncbi:DNA helicase B [Chelonia mydas]|uniref:DNA helicase B n=1 Tax=Chelonia mydas TaxID=8469 RepID=M7C239_CHEMY|nr:DNA helicase B [Chelonia mydas]
MALARGRTRPVSELWGVLLPAKDLETEGEEEQDDPDPDPDPLFLDASELCSSGRVLRASLPARRKGKTVLVALSFPLIMEFLPRLLPRHFCNIMKAVSWHKVTKQSSKSDEKEKVSPEDETLPKLDEMLKNEPWKLGFSRVIYSFYSWRLKDGQMPWKFSTVTVLVVDEGSLVPVQTLSSVLKLLCDHAQLAKLIILGDIRQLPSIDPGNMLADIFEGLKSRGWSVELRTNHRAESQLIVDNATRISQRKFPEFDSVIKVCDWSETLTMPSPEKKFIYVVLPSGNGAHYLQTAIKTLLEKGPGLQDAKQSQFIAFRRNHKNRMVFQCDDKICSTRNAYLKDLLPKNNTACTRESDSQNPNQCECRGCCGRKAFLSGQKLPCDLGGSAEDDRRLCNGEIFFITDGSEEKTIVYVVGNAGPQHWQHVYTAVTRGRCRVYIVAEPTQLRKAVSTKSFPRKTRLQQRLRETFAETSDSPEQMSSHLKGCWQSQGHDVQPGPISVTEDIPLSSVPVEDDFIKAEESVGLNDIQTNNGQWSTAELASAGSETPVKSNRCKRQGSFTDSFESPSKLTMVNVEDSPLGSTRLQNLTLRSPTPKQLFGP